MGSAEQAAGQGGPGRGRAGQGSSGRHRRPDPAWPGRNDARRRADRWSAYRPTRHARPEVGPTTPLPPLPTARSRATGPAGHAVDAEADQPAEPEPAPADPHPTDTRTAPTSPPPTAPAGPGTSRAEANQGSEPGKEAGPPAAGTPGPVVDQAAGSDPAAADPHLSGTLAPRTALTTPPPAEPGDLGAPRPVDPLVDSGSVGLRMFNLGTIPASVTPPRSWRRAAWFAIASSAAALVGLLAAGALLVGPTHDRGGRIIALPYFPDGSPLRTIGGPTDEPTTLGHRRDTTRDTTTVRPDSRSAVAPAGGPTTAPGGTTHIVPTAGGSATAGDPTGTPGQPANPPVLAPPDPVTVTGGATGDPVADPAKMIRRTRTFFAEVTSNAQAAANLTAGTLHDDAVALIRQRYGDVSTIKIERISLDPGNGVTVCLLRVVNKDGSAQTQRTTLHFTLSSDPKITNPGG